MTMMIMIIIIILIATSSDYVKLHLWVFPLNEDGHAELQYSLKDKNRLNTKDNKTMSNR